ASGERVLRRAVKSTGTEIYTYPFGLMDIRYSSSGVQVLENDYYTLAGRLIGEQEAGVTIFLLTDELGSVLTSISAAAGSAAVTSNQVYSPYGAQRYRKGAVPTDKGFTGQYLDASGLNYDHARYYDAVVGRFVSADIKQGNAQGMDPYSYVGNNPETKNDPTGEYFTDPNGDVGYVHKDPSSGKIVVDTFNPHDYIYVPARGCGSCHKAVPHYYCNACHKPVDQHLVVYVVTVGNTKVTVITYAGALAPSLSNLVERLIQGNEQFARYGAAGWRLEYAVYNGDVVNSQYPGDPYTERWYLTFRTQVGIPNTTDQDGNPIPSQVTLSITLNPNASSTEDAWNMRGAKFSSNQPQDSADIWGEGGSMRGRGVDPGEDSNPPITSEDEEYLKMLQIEEEGGD
ncbi:MAG: RHS repeat-associated core domain-containing protein, partial [Ktedonobacteraceae bacterium]